MITSDCSTRQATRKTYKRSTMFFLVHLVLFLLINGVASNDDGFIFNGTATLGGMATVTEDGLIILTDKTTLSVAHAFYPLPFNFKNSSTGNAFSFSTTFIFAIVREKPHLNGHGMTFLISPSKEIIGAGNSQNLGLFNRTNNGNSSNHIVAIELDTFLSEDFGDINDNHVGIDINSLVSVESKPAAYFSNENGEFENLTLASGKKMQVWVDYDGIGQKLNVILSPLGLNKPDVPLLSLDIDLSLFILDQMYVGFSSSTSLVVQYHYVLGWSFQLNGKAQEIDLSRLPSLPGSEHSKKKQMVLAIGLSLTGVVLVSVAIFMILSWVRRKAKFSEILEDWELKYGPHRFSYKDLYVGTKGFKEKELLGKGGFGQVYRGVLPASKMQVAVKRISHESKQGMKEFVAEIATIGRLRHPNLVRLLGYCRREGELLLVYDFMPNSSLDKFIYNEPEVTLNWQQRFRIIKDVASGIAYLHEQWLEVIIHRDIKASNVLLDGEFNGKLGDFGLARCYSHAHDPQTTRLAGTLGYIAPELARNGKATTGTDVFAFGAFCLEVACGRRPTEPWAQAEEVLLVDWALECWRKGDIFKIVDPKLKKSFVAQEMDLVLKLGLLCSQTVAALRPSISQVLKYLNGHASLPKNLDAHLQAQEHEGSNDRAILNHSTLWADESRPSMTITESFRSIGR